MLRIWLLIVALLLTGCSDAPAPVPVQKRERPIVGQFQAKTYPVGEHEHITMFDMPGYWEPTRCWVWESTRTNTSHMRCDTDVPEMPQAQSGQ